MRNLAQKQAGHLDMLQKQKPPPFLEVLINKGHSRRRAMEVLVVRTTMQALHAVLPEVVQVRHLESAVGPVEKP